MKHIIRKLIICLMLFVILLTSNALTIKATTTLVSNNTLDTANPESDFYQNIEEYLPTPTPENEAYYTSHSEEEIATTLASYEVVEMRTPNTKTFEYEDQGITYIFSDDVHAYNEETGQYEDIDSTLTSNGRNTYSPTNTNYDIKINEDMSVSIGSTKLTIDTTLDLHFQEVIDNELIFTNSDNTVDLVIGVDNDIINIDFYFYTPTTIDDTITFNFTSQETVTEYDDAYQTGDVVMNKPTYIVENQNPVPVETTTEVTENQATCQVKLDGHNLNDEMVYPVNLSTTASIDAGRMEHNTVKEGYPDDNYPGLQLGYIGYDDGGVVHGDVPWQQTRTYVIFETPNPNDPEYYPEGPYLSEEFVDITNATFHLYQIRGSEAGNVIQMFLVTDSNTGAADEVWENTNWDETVRGYTWNNQTEVFGLDYPAHTATTLSEPGWLEFDITESFADLVGEEDDGQIANRGYVLMMEDEIENEDDTSYSEAVLVCMKSDGNQICPQDHEPYVTYTYTKASDVSSSFPVEKSSVHLNPLVNENSNGTRNFDSLTAHGITNPEAAIKIDVVNQVTGDIVYSTSDVKLSEFYSYPDHTPAYNGGENDKDDVSNWETSSRIPKGELENNTAYYLNVTFSKDGVSSTLASEQFGYYTVVEGDSVESIMRQFDIMGNKELEKQFLNDNNLSSVNDKIYVGDTLFVRQEAKEWDTTYNPPRITPIPDAAPITIYAREVTPEIKYEKHVDQVEDPITINTGNYTIDTYDFIVTDGSYEYQFRRMYDSMGGGQIGSFGVNWSSMLDASLSFYPNGDIYFNYGAGGILFIKDGDQYVSEVANNTYTLMQTGDKYIITINNNKELKFSSNGKLENITYDNHVFSLKYNSDGNIETITLPNGQKIKFITNGLGMITEITLPDGSKVKYTYDSENNLVKVTNQVGKTMEYTYDDKHLLTSYTDYNGNVVIENVYDEYGRVISQTNADGNTATIEYDDENLVNTVTDYDGTVTSYVLDEQLATTEIIGDVNESSVYDENLNLTSYTYPNGDVMTYEYNSDNLLVKETRSVDNKSQTYVYDQNNNISQVTTFDGEVYKYTYDEFGNIKSITYPNGTQELYTYDSKGYKTSYTDQNGNVTNYEYNSNHQLTTDGTNSFSYDANGNITYLKVNQMGYTLTRDEMGRVTHITDDNGAVYEIRYDGNSNIVYEKNFVNQEYTIVYDASNNPIKKVFPDGSTEIYTYDDMGNVLTYENQIGTTLYYEYDEYGNQVKTTNEDEIVISETAYGSNQEQLYSVDQNGLKTTYVYDEYYNLSQEVLPNGEIIYYEYDQNNNLIKKYSDTYIYEQNTYNSNNQLATQTVDGITTTYTYDKNGNIISQSSTNGITTTNEYDAKNQVISTTTNGITNYTTYDKYGNIIETTDANGATTTTNYSLGRVSSECDSYDNCVAYTYYPNGQVKTETDANLNTTTYKYDHNGNIISEEINGQVTTYTYDLTGNLLTTVYPDGSSDINTYDKYGNQISYTNRDGVITTTTYDEHGNVTSTTDGNGNTTTYDYSDDFLTTTTTLPNGEYSTQVVNNLGNTMYEENTTYHKEYTYYNNQIATETIYAGEEVVCIINNTYDAKMNLTKTNDCNNQQTTYKYDELNQVVSETFNGITTNYTYDKVGNLTKQTIGEQTTSFKYDLNHNVISETNAEGQTTSYKYDGNNNMVEYHNPEDLTIKVNYDHNNNYKNIAIGINNIAFTTTFDGYITSATLPNNTKVYREYDSYGNITKEINQLGYYKAYSYDNNYNLVSERDENGNTIKYTYDEMNNQIKKVDAEENVTDYKYDVNNNLVSEKSKDSTITYEYNNKNQVITETNNDYTKYYEYSNNNNVTKIYDDQKTIESYTYNSNSQITSQYVDSNYTDYTYDKYGNVKTETVNGLTTSYSYNKLNQVITTTDYNNKTTKYTYNFYGNVTSEYVVNSDALITHEYNKYNQLVKETYAEGQTYHYTYDNANNLVSTTLPNGGKINYQYDDANNLIGETDALGNTTYYRYDNVGNVIGEAHGANSIYQVENNYTYNGNNQLTSVEDGKSNTTTYSYEEENVTEKTDANGDKFTYTYDKFNNLTSVKSYNYQETYNYDSYGNVTSSQVGDTKTTYTYDNDNNLTSKESGDETITYTYNDNHQVTETNYEDSNLNITYQNNLIKSVNQDGQEIKYSYDELGRITSITYPDESKVMYTYDKSNRITSVCQGKECYSYKYNKLDQVTQVKQGNNITNITYDLNGQVTKLEIIIENKVHDTYSYKYDTVGNLIQETHNGQVTKYTYDDNNQLISYSNDEISESYEYDKIGNRTSKTTNGETTEYVYENDLLVETTGAEPATYDYDDQGNLILKKEEDQITKYTYNNFNQLIVIEDTTGLTTTLSYDGLGNLIGSYNVKRDFRKELTIEYLKRHTETYNEQYEIEESLEYYKTYNPDVVDIWQDTLLKTGYTVEELQAYKPEVTEYSYVNDLTREYPAPLVINNENVVYGNNKLEAGDTNYYYDGLNNVVLTQNEQLNSYSYDPFGNTDNSSYGYNAELHMNELQYLRARYYDPETGRFIQRDTYLGELNNPASQNRYTYCANNPIYYDDPSGNIFGTYAYIAYLYVLPALSNTAVTRWTTNGADIPTSYFEASKEVANIISNQGNQDTEAVYIDVKIIANVSNDFVCTGVSEEYCETLSKELGNILNTLKKILHNLTTISQNLIDEATSEQYYYDMYLVDNKVDVEEDKRFNDIYITGEIVFDITQGEKVESSNNSSNNSNKQNSSTTQKSPETEKIPTNCEEYYYVPYIDYSYNGKNGISYE